MQLNLTAEIYRCPEAKAVLEYLEKQERDNANNVDVELEYLAARHTVLAAWGWEREDMRATFRKYEKIRRSQEHAKS
jgi:hypothetical protein